MKYAQAINALRSAQAAFQKVMAAPHTKRGQDTVRAIVAKELAILDALLAQEPVKPAAPEPAPLEAVPCTSS